MRITFLLGPGTMGEERTDLQRHLPFGPCEGLNSLAVCHVDEVVATPSSEASVSQPSANPLLQPASMTETVEPGGEQPNKHRRIQATRSTWRSAWLDESSSNVDLAVP